MNSRRTISLERRIKIVDLFHQLTLGLMSTCFFGMFFPAFLAGESCPPMTQEQIEFKDNILMPVGVASWIGFFPLMFLAGWLMGVVGKLKEKTDIKT